MIKLFSKFHCSKLKKPSDKYRKASKIILKVLLLLDPDILYHLFATLHPHINSSSVAAVLCLQGSDTIIAIIIVSFVFYFKTFYTIIGKKVFKDQFALAFTVIAAFIRHCNIDITVKILCHTGCITAFHSGDHIV